ncbi:MAG: Uracil-DNA glycosylase, family 1 [uncultured Sulfurovum sp.]|uniref:Uracil-DNA glycosylase n=1 Tax=uncultured Sulfurovum sp. TaxID=269237 RepID=A0A6S6TM73_9BACT|nr:MAG: Uracil-DNA glycosylase, family 1 [uncultured Sulfurovum sp.]
MKTNITQLTWKKALAKEWEKSYMQELETFLEKEAKLGKVILPPKKLWFEALNSTPLDEVKVLILGQDPYPTVGHAHGLCFSVLDGVKPLPKSLQNINKELLSDCNVDNTHTGNLLPWAKQGVLLLNAVLTVEKGNANAHKDKGWEQFTNRVIELVSSQCENVVFVLWGAYAQKKSVLIDVSKHLVIKDPHPSPLSAYRGFWGSKPFSKINSYLEEKGKVPIVWKLETKKSASLFE